MPIVRLKAVKFGEKTQEGKEWMLDGLTLGPINLIVGLNATGKTRTLNVINSLAKFLMPESKFRTSYADYDVSFDNDGQPLRYTLKIDEGKVIEEKVELDGVTLLSRGLGGEGEIFAKEEGKRIRFKPPENELAAVARRDSLQHPFLEPLHEWAAGVRHYTFETTLGKDHIALFVKGGPETDERDANQVVALFRKAESLLKQPFVEAVKRDMVAMRYDIEAVGLRVPQSIKLVQPGLPSEFFVLYVKEEGIDGYIEQHEMSQGMFRALSIVIQLNYSQMARRANCILIDDIGEGLDFDRSVRLIELLRSKSRESAFQLIMTTNDQFVMNNVPLEEWSVLQRQGSHLQVRNYENSRTIFEDFRFVGLSNFSFLEMDFVNNPPAEEVATHE